MLIPLLTCALVGPEKIPEVLNVGLINIGGVLELKLLRWVCKVMCV